MLIVLTLWFVTLFVFVSLGDLCIVMYNKLTSQAEHYNLLDTFLIGMCSTLVLLGITSIWLPSNLYMLIVYVLVSIVYWSLRRQHLRKWVCSFVSICKSLSRLHLVYIVMIVFSISLLMSFISWYVYDSIYYHYQLTAIYEQYCAIPGIANIESRLGFNSNYLLLSALFSLNTELGEPIYIHQSLLLLLSLIWVVYELITRKYDVRVIALLLLYGVFIGRNVEPITNSSTDIYPSLIILYLGSSIILYPHRFLQKNLLLFIVPISLLTFKLSIAPFVIISIYIFYRLIKQKHYRSVGFLVFFTVLMVTPWLVRNVIISGYLIYPLLSLDLFSFDWKLPAHVLELETNYIKDCAYKGIQASYKLNAFKPFSETLASKKGAFVFAVFSLVANTIALLGIPFILYKVLFNKTKHIALIVLLFSLLGTVLVWLMAPDLRFIWGALYVLTFFFFSVIIDKDNSSYPKIGKFVLFSFAITLCLSCVIRSVDYFKPIKDRNHNAKFYSFVKRPYGVKVQTGISDELFDTYDIGNLTIYTTAKFSYNYVPCTIKTDSIEGIKQTLKFYPIQGVEARGGSLEAGFRPKTDFDESLWARDRDWWQVMLSEK